MAAQRRRKPTVDPADLDTLQGVIQRITFGPTEDGFTIIKVWDEAEQQQLTALGNIVNPRVDDEYCFRGEWVEKPPYGRQFKIMDYQVMMPTTRRGAIAYLCAVGTGIGPAKAERIVNELGEDCLGRLKDDPSLLKSVAGITEDQVDQIAHHLAGNAVLAELMGLICREGITSNLATKIYQKYKTESVKIIKENPYLLADEMHGIGFITADKIAHTVGIHFNNPYRVEAIVNYLLHEAANSGGHCYLTPNELLSLMHKEKMKLGIELEDVSAGVKRLQEKGTVIREGDCLYHKGLFRAETEVARHLKRLLAVKVAVDPEVVTRLLAEAQEAAELEYSPEQLRAVEVALTQPVSVITGGPGTGKSEITNLIVDSWKRLHTPVDDDGESFEDIKQRYAIIAGLVEGEIYLVAPTGRAAKRLGEATKHEAGTIHRLLGYQPPEGFLYNERCKLWGPSLMVIDEISMLDVELAHSFMQAFPDNMQVVCVGDVDQLPSVGPGSVLRDMILSGVVPTTRLIFNYRQARGSKVAEYANFIQQGVVPPLYDDGDWQVRLIPDGKEHFCEVVDVVLSEVAKAREEGHGVMDIMALAPQKKGTAGVNALNEALRELLNPATDDEPDYLGKFREGDKVMVIKNDYNRWVFNGDMGIVSLIVRHSGDHQDYSPGVVVEIDGKDVHFSPDAVSKLVMAYASTVHKSQGSQFPVVISVCTSQSTIMNQRNLLYTGVTRAQGRHILVGQADAIAKTVKNDRIATRNSRLAELLQPEKPEKEGEGN